MSEWATIAIRFALYVDLMLLFGLPLFGIYNRSAWKAASALPVRPLVALSAAGGLLLSVIALFLLASSMSGAPLGEVDRETVGMLLTGSSIGTAWKVRMAALTGVLILSPFLYRQPGLTLSGTLLASAIALATLAWTGHGAADEGTAGWAHLAADIVHLLASAAWVGALVALVLLIFKPARTLSAEHLSLSHDALAGFATVGTIAVALILLSGIVNSWMLIGPAHISALFTTLYGQLLMAKLLLFAAMLGLAASNRFRLTPALERSLGGGDHQAALVGLRKSLAIETGAAVLILFLVAWLGTLEPPAAAT